MGYAGRGVGTHSHKKVLMMRHGENPLAVTKRIKEKIQELQPALPRGVRIVPAYDRTRLIKGAIHTLTEVMWHEMVIAAIAILIILVHVRSVFVICGVVQPQLDLTRKTWASSS